ncbi:TetR/AcrR family transcriptional regulator C-terminal domain-containing protein [Mumia sp. DW29H23]|uniref:TetR/AcrR family transcriptional regulator C-terminal domain-containing protein n=1 Tax=Mumia sp. DW29H23 TaxID=3421241 RepID=UPI003D696F1D
MAARRRQGERAGLTADQVLDAAVALAERDGVEKLSMRRLAAEVGVEAMTIYHYVPSKDALLDGIVERVVAEAVRVPPDAADWQAMLVTYAYDLRASLLAHPSVVPLLATRPAVTTATARIVEGILEALGRAGLDPVNGLRLVHALTALVIGQLTTQGDGSDAGDDLAVDQERFPLLSQAVAGGAADPEARFAFAIEALVAGAAPAAGD